MLLLDAPLDSQPQELVDLDYSNSATTGLLGFWHAGMQFQPTSGLPEQVAWDLNTATAQRESNGVSTSWLVKTSGNAVIAALSQKPTPTDATTVLMSGRISPVGFFSEGAASTGYGFWDLGGGVYRFIFRASGQGGFTQFDIPLSDGAVGVFGFTYDGATVRFVRDGVVLGSAAATGTVLYNNSGSPVPITIGAFSGGLGGGGYSTANAMEWFGIWDRALSDGELRALVGAPYQLFRAPLDAWAPRVTPTVLTPDATLANTDWSAVGAASLHAALAAGDSDYITASADGASATVSLSNPVPNLIDLTSVVVSVRHRVT
ncbi:MAG: LamG domain-containing protein [Gemmatimonas sp.]|nr:LamG domain-containing protein [Gemmatimonas sp.]